METSLPIAGAALVLLALAAVLVVLLRSRVEARRDLAAAHAETSELRARLDALADRLESTSTALEETREAAYLITDAGSATAQPAVPDRLVLSATLGEPLVKVVAFGHGLRRALSAESRNRIWFEMRREVRRARKQRRRDMKDAWRRVQAEERAGQGTERPADAA